MSASVLEATSYTQLLQAPASDGPYLYPRIFQDTGMMAGRRLKAKFRILQSLDGYLKKILQPGEKVFFVSHGILSDAWEHAFMGWVAALINRKAFVFTSQRLILVQLKGKFKVWDLKSTIDYASIARLKKTLMGRLTIKLHNGKSLAFGGIPRQDRKFIATTIQELIGKLQAEKNKRGETFLCPECGAAVDGYPPACPACGRAFKQVKKAALLSLLFPGLGDFYLGHRGLAVMEMLGTALAWIVLMAPDPETPRTPGYYLFMIPFLLVFAHGIDCLLTRHIARKGLYPG